MSDNDDDFMCEDEEDYGLVSGGGSHRDPIVWGYDVFAMLWKFCRKYLFFLNQRPVV